MKEADVGVKTKLKSFNGLHAARNLTVQVLVQF